MQSDSGLRHRPKRTANGGVGERDVSSSKAGGSRFTSPLTVLEFALALSLVFGGCCVNVLSFESLLRRSSSLGSAITFGQMLFITCQSLPSFLTRDASSLLPRLASRQVPLHVWALQVLVLLSSSLLNNWSFAFTPLTLQIVFRSSGLSVSLLLGRIFLKRSYSPMQVASVLVVTMGVIMATVAGPSSSTAKTDDNWKSYTIGISMLSLSLLLTGILGILQEQTYTKYGPCWREGVLYTHLLSLPLFSFLVSDIRAGILALTRAQEDLPMAYILFAGNLLTQLLCVSGVNQLTSRVSSVSTNLVLTARKALSLCLSVWLFGSEWNYGLVAGASLVFAGSICYAMQASRRDSS